jgi:flavin-dependent dehydrogenase
MSNDFDVVVVGGRVAGASTAMLLARAGARVALLDRASYGTDTVSTHGLMRGGVLQLVRWGLLDDMVAAGTPPIHRTLFTYADGGADRIAIRASGGVDALYAPRRLVLDRLLVDAAVAAGAEVMHETSVTALLRDDNGRVGGVVATDRWGRTFELRGTITVGADGFRSTVADEAGAAYLRRGRAASAVLYRYYADIGTSDYEWAWAVGGGAGFTPTNDGLTCVFVSATPARMRAQRHHGGERAFVALLAETAPDLAGRVRSATPDGRLHGWPGLPGFVRQSWGPGWALVGDAGYFKDPITMHGITDALRDAELLADALLEALGGEVTETAPLARYQATRDRISSDLYDVTESIASYDWDLDEVRTLLRSVSSATNDEVELLQSLPDRRGTPLAAAARVRS